MTSTVLNREGASAQWFHALSDETRLEIIERLSRGEQCVCDLTDALDAAQSRLSFHLKTLRDAGLVIDRRDGRWVYYRLNPEVCERIAAATATLSAAARRTADTLCCDNRTPMTQLRRRKR